MPLGLRVARHAVGESQAATGDACGVSQHYLSRIERGVETPSRKLRHRLARHFGVDEDLLFNSSGAELMDYITREFRYAPIE